jgi:uncharacterized membrane protein YbaN (DUF454 family)
MTEIVLCYHRTRHLALLAGADHAPSAAMGTVAKGLYIVAGFVLVALAALGVFLPLLPTTPLLLLAAWCFAKSSDKYHRWLMEHQIFGPIIRNWHERRCIPRNAKSIAVASILIFGTYAIGFAIENLWIRLFGTAVLLTGLVFVLRIKVCTPDQ